MNHIVFFIIWAISFIPVYLGHYHSLRDMYYGGREGNALWRDEYGYYDGPKGILFKDLFWAVFAAVHFIPGIGPWAWVLPASVGGLFIWIVQSKLSNQKASRAKQLEKLAAIRAQPDYWDSFVGAISSKNGVYFAAWFPWLRLGTLDELRFRLISLAKDPGGLPE